MTDQTNPRPGSLYYRPLPDGYEIVVYPLTFGEARLCYSRQHDDDTLDTFYYHDRSRAIAAAREWTGKGDPKDDGWYRHLNTDRRRVARQTGDAARRVLSAKVERYFIATATELDGPSDLLISSATLTQLGAHECMRLWSRGGLAGELLVAAGDGERLAVALGLSERAAL